MTLDEAAELRRRARAHAEVRILRPDGEHAEAEADALYWDRIPLDERAEFVWKLSTEVFALDRAEGDEPRLSRSVARVTRR